jgi:hypothetical protein
MRRSRQKRTFGISAFTLDTQWPENKHVLNCSRVEKDSEVSEQRRGGLRADIYSRASKRENTKRAARTD